MKKIFQNLRNNNGFTIIELIVSIFILSIGVIGIFNALSVITILTSDSADRLTATYLGQEGMEIVRNIRDTNWLNMDTAAASGSLGLAYSWVDGLTPDGAYSHPNCNTLPCEADYTAWSMSSGQDYLYLNGNGFYVYNPTDLSAKRTKFQRKIIITPVTDVDAIALPFPPYHIIKVTVQVSWDRKATVLSSGVLASTCGPTNCITTEGTLYNWYNTAISVVSITINDPTKNNTSLHVGDSYQLTDTINPTNATNKSISWSSDNPAVISVDNTGLVAAVGPGTANIYAVTADGSKKDTDFFQVVNK